jgi:hypothetical protein
MKSIVKSCHAPASISEYDGTERPFAERTLFFLNTLPSDITSLERLPLPAAKISQLKILRKELNLYLLASDIISYLKLNGKFMRILHNRLIVWDTRFGYPDLSKKFIFTASFHFYCQEEG